MENIDTLWPGKFTTGNTVCIVVNSEAEKHPVSLFLKARGCLMVQVVSIGENRLQVNGDDTWRGLRELEELTYFRYVFIVGQCSDSQLQAIQSPIRVRCQRG